MLPYCVTGQQHKRPPSVSDSLIALGCGSDGLFSSLLFRHTMLPALPLWKASVFVDWVPRVTAPKQLVLLSVINVPSQTPTPLKTSRIVTPQDTLDERSALNSSCSGLCVAAVSAGKIITKRWTTPSSSLIDQSVGIQGTDEILPLSTTPPPCQ